MRIYLDHNAGTPIRPAAREAIARFAADEVCGNPASIHHAGQRARRMLELAREQVASLIGAPPRSIVFTSGGTEANNLALHGVFAAANGRPVRIVTSAIEHSSVLAPIAELERRGCDIVRLAPDRDGRIPLDALDDAARPGCALISIGLANTEVGTIQDGAGIAGIATGAGALFHLDAVQAVGRVPLRVDDLGCDLLSISGHKFGGPPGIGALYVRPGVRLAPHLTGGSNEVGLRAGTPNLIGAIAMGAAVEEATQAMVEGQARIATLAELLHERLRAAIPALTLNGPRDGRLRNTLNLTFPAVAGESMLIALDLAGVEVSMGSACAAGAVEPSHVLLAMGRSAAEARSSLRISLGWSTTADEIARAAEIIPRVWRRVATAEPIAASGAVPTASSEAVQ